jgi:small conductance mechanosensitive channel
MFANINLEQFYEDAFRVLIIRVPKIILILVLIFVAVRLLRYLLKRLRKHIDENEALLSDSGKAKTLVSILNSVGGVVIYTIGVLTILHELNINIAPIIAGVGILGLAIGFGAQALVKDLITGFFMLMENQYAIGDFVNVGDKSGTVEAMGLRITRLRDFEGMVHFIPHGSINEVTNYSREWGRGILDFEVPYSEDINRVAATLRGVCNDIANDDDFSSMFLEPPDVCGVEELGNTSVRVRVTAKTHHESKYTILREFRLRAKKRFDELGIRNAKQENAVWLMNKGEHGTVPAN